ncbi:MAG: aldo/keto reductase [Geminicoccaceae bacterium]|nr:aldo/keto reductase [Geminicoccaceae bacterium]
MEKVTVGEGGPSMTRIVAGAMRLLQSEETRSVEGLARFIDQLLDCGIDWFDHADIYGQHGVEEHFGRATALLGERRRAVRLVSKCGIQMVSPGRPQTRIRHYDTTAIHVRTSVERSLRLLGVERLDLLLIHRPDPLFDAPAVGRMLDELVAGGLIAHAGVSNFTPSQMEMLQAHMHAPLVTNQVQHSLVHGKALMDGTFDHAQRTGWRPMLWSPLAAAATLGDEARPELRQKLVDYAGRLGCDPATLVLAWAMHHPTVPVAVIGTTRIERFRSLLGAVELAGNLDREIWFDLYQTSMGQRIP